MTYLGFISTGGGGGKVVGGIGRDLSVGCGSDSMLWTSSSSITTLSSSLSEFCRKKGEKNPE